MTYPRSRPAYRLHSLVSALDDVADRLLAEEFGTSYARFLALVTIERLGEPTQAQLAQAHGVSAPATSRMVQTLEEAGLVSATRVAGAGNRRTVRLTAAGARLVTDGGELLESSFERLLGATDVTAADVLGVTEPLLAVLSPKLS